MITFMCISKRICNGKIQARENDILKTFYFILKIFMEKFKDEKRKIIKKIKSFVSYFKRVWD